MTNFQLRMVLIGIIGIFIGVLGTAGVWWYHAHQGIEPYIVEGYSNGTNYDMTAIGISSEPGEGGNSYVIAGASWREFGGPWHDQGSPPSLEYPSSGQRVRMGVIDYKPTKYAGGSSVVVWYEVIDVVNKGIE